MAKSLKLFTATNCYTIAPSRDFSFLNFTHTVISLGGFCDGNSLWIPLGAIQAVTYTDGEERVSAENLYDVSTMTQ